MEEELSQVKIQDIIKKNAQKEENILHFSMPISSPIDIFVLLPTLQDKKKRYIYFIGYRMGKEKVTLWGVYDKIDKKIIIDSACVDVKFTLAKFIKRWKQIGYHHVGAEQYNHFAQIYDKYNSEMKKLVYELAWLRGEITQEEAKKNANISLDEFYDVEIKLQKEADHEEWPLNEYLDKYNETLRKDNIDKILFHIDYKIMKANIDRFTKKIKESTYHKLFPESTYKRFLKRKEELDLKNETDIIEDYKDEIKKYEDSINFFNIDNEIKKIFERNELDLLEEFLTMLKKTFETSDISKIYKNECPIDCEENYNIYEPNCGYWQYGNNQKYKLDNEMK